MCLALLQHMKEDAPYRLTGSRREASEPVRLILRDLYLKMTLLCKISSISSPVNQTLHCQDEGYRNVVCN